MRKLEILAGALKRIEIDLDVECQCHGSHGSLCPKRIAQRAWNEYVVSEEAPRFAGNLADNEALVEAVALALTQNGQVAQAFHGYGGVAKEFLEQCRKDATCALRAVDEFQP